MPVLGSLVLITYDRFFYSGNRVVTMPGHVTEVLDDGPGIVKVVVVDGDVRTAVPAGGPADLLLRISTWQWPETEPAELLPRGEPSSAAEIERRFNCNEDLIPFWGREDHDPSWERLKP